MLIAHFVSMITHEADGFYNWYGVRNMDLGSALYPMDTSWRDFLSQFEVYLSEKENEEKKRGFGKT